MISLTSDIRHAVRAFRASPGMVGISILSLGFGVGVNLALFAGLRAAFFYEPTVADAARVVSVRPGNSNQFSYLNYRDLRDSGIFESVAGSRRVALTWRSGDAPEPLNGLAVTANFPAFIGVPPAAGRWFSEAEATPERQPRVVVLSHPFWTRRFGASPGVVGQEMVINGEPFAIIGVLPEVRPITMLQNPDVYVPISRLVLPTVVDRTNGNALAVLGRLRPGTTEQQALAAVTALGQRLERSYPDENPRMGQPAGIVPLRGGDLAGTPEQFMVPAVLLSLFGLVLLSACANVAGLLLARAVGRQREIALRFALGGSRARVVRLLLTESSVLAVLGTLPGMLLSMWLMSAMSSIVVPGEGRIELALQPSIAWAGYALALVIGTAILSGLAPALRTARQSLTATLQDGGGHTMTGRLWLRHLLVVGQVAVCLVLLVLSSLLVRSLSRVTAMNPGFEVDRGLVARVQIDPERYARDGGVELAGRLVARLDGLPGVASASFANIVPLGSDRSATSLSVQGVVSEEAGPRTYVNSVAPRYFATLGIPFVRGRDFVDADRAGAPPVAIVSESFERAYFAGRSALERRVRQSQAEPYFEIVGVVRDHMYGSYGDAATPIFYTAYAQRPNVSTQIRPLILHVRTTVPPAALARDVRLAVAAVEPTVVTEVETLREATSSEAGQRRVAARLLGSAGALGLLLATTGLYAMLAFVVSNRRAEIGIRMALGATTAQILGGVLAQGLTLVGIGVGVGTIVSLSLSWMAAGMLAGLSPADPVAFVGAAALLVIVALASCTGPAMRAARVDPLAALRRL
ncbi:MAG TPA: ADOP family duplicated permease [Vicinamibacterales bacterium]|nr:ADOP family duplicated permease [Vicinamibacterales bacterium]